MAFFTLPPTIADNAEDRKWGKGQIENASVQRLGRPLTHLLCSTGTDGTLSFRRGRHGKKKAQDQYNQSVLFYNEFFIFRMIHNSGVESQKYDY
jgi:hypothetical protein